MQEVLELAGQRIAVPPALRLGAVGDLQLLALGHAQRLLQGVDPVVDRLLVGGEPVEHLLGGHEPLLAVDVGVGVDDPAAGVLQEAVQHLLDLLLELVLLGVGAGDGADAAGDQRLPAVAVPHAGVPAEGRVADVELDHLRFEERLAGADPLLRVLARAAAPRWCPRCRGSGWGRRW